MYVTRRRFVSAGPLAFVGGSLLALALNRATIVDLCETLIQGIHDFRCSSLPGDAPFFVLQLGVPYVQARTDSDSTVAEFEVGSAKSDPALKPILTRERIGRVTSLGFDPPGVESTNYRQTIDLNSLSRVKLAARIMSSALEDVFGARDERELGIQLSFPGRPVATRPPRLIRSGVSAF